MSLALTKSNFEQLIDDRNNTVIALSGRWGSGKSHMWRQVQKESTNDKVTNSLYVSLFGVKDILQLKLRIIQSAIPDSKSAPIVRDIATGAIRQVMKFAKGFHPAFSALDELALLAVPAILRNRIIVMDDIERKHADFSIEEVMGFIDEFTQIHGSRILLILNSDQLGDKEMWDKLREKVIDHEIALTTTPTEAFDIAVASELSPYADHIRSAVEVCEIANIRIVKKIIRAVNRLLNHRSDLDDHLLRRVVPSTVLMCAIHYRGLEDGPSLEFVLGFNSVLHDLGERERLQEASENSAPEAERWVKLLRALNIVGCDEYEHMVAAFLQSGLRIDHEVNVILDRYVSEKDAMSSQERVRYFYDLVLWHPALSDQELLAEAQIVAKYVNMVDGYTVSNLHTTISDLPGGELIADAMLSEWLSAFNQAERAQFRHDDAFDRPLHPAVLATYLSTERRLHPIPSLVDACLRIASDQWGEEESEALRASTPESYKQAIESLAGENLKIFMRKNIALYPRRLGYETDFGDAMDNFVTACRLICYENEASRLSRLIRKLFINAKISSLLDVYDWPRPLQEDVAGST